MERTLANSSGKPLVSIITIVLNGKSVIRQTMDSVLRQNYEPMEYIVIDGGSTDGTVAIVDQYKSHLSYWKSEVDRGISDAFNKGIGNARGEIIGLLNAGDWYEPGAVQCVVDTFMAQREAGVVCGSMQFWKGSRREYLCRSEPELLEREMTVTHPTCFLRAHLYDQVGLFSTKYRLAMDYELLLRIRMHGSRFISLDRVLANMQHGGVSEAHWQEALRETHRARRELLSGSFFATGWYYSFLSLKRRIRIMCERKGWDGLLRFYRRRLALVRKTKETDR